MTEDIDRFVQLCQKFATIDLLADGPPPPPWGNSPTQEAVKAAIDGGASGLPQRYQDEYAAKLLSAENLPKVLGLPPKLLETVTGAVYQHAAASEVQLPLQRFLAVISNLYHSFTEQLQGSAIPISMGSTLPPLALFQHSAKDGPFTITSDTMNRAFGISVAVVSLPSAYRDHPVLWASLAHETGGHDVKHASGELLASLRQSVRALFGTDPLPSDFRNLTPDQVQGILWSSWIDEAAADVYGLLNMGPTYALNFSSYLAALRYRSNPDAMPLPSLVTQAAYNGNVFLDSHPIDILRPYLAIGVIQTLDRLSETVRDHYITLLKQIAQRCAQGATKVAIQRFVPSGPDRPDVALLLDVEVSLEDIQDLARRVGGHIATVQLPMLANHNIQDIETWDDADESIAQQIAAALQDDLSVAGMGDDAQLLAGSTLALLADTECYASVTARLAEALEHSYQHDPTWGTP
jgi:hypothetical protein